MSNGEIISRSKRGQGNFPFLLATTKVTPVCSGLSFKIDDPFNPTFPVWFIRCDHHWLWGGRGQEWVAPFWSLSAFLSFFFFSFLAFIYKPPKHLASVLNIQMFWSNLYRFFFLIWNVLALQVNIRQVKCMEVASWWKMEPTGNQQYPSAPRFSMASWLNQK